MFVETLWNFIQFTDSPLVNFSAALFITILSCLFIYRVINIPFIRAEFAADGKSAPLWEWILKYWLSIPLVALLYFRDFWRLMLTVIITAAMIVIYILRRIVQFQMRGDKISAYLFWLMEMENSAGEILDNERNSHKQQINYLNRQVAAARNVSSAYRQASVNIVDLIGFAQRSGGYYNMQWVAAEAKRGLTTAIQRAESVEKQLRNMQGQAANPAQGKKGQNSKDYVSYTTNGGKQQKQPKQNGQRQQQGQQPNGFNPYGQGQGQWQNQDQWQNQGQQPFVQPNGQPMSKTQMKKMEKERQRQQQQGYQGQADPRQQPHQYRPEADFVVPPLNQGWGGQSQWNNQFNEQPYPQNQGWGNGYNQDQQPYQQFQEGFDGQGQWQGQGQQPFVQPDGQFYPVRPDWLPQEPVWNPEPERRDKNQRPTNYR